MANTKKAATNKNNTIKDTKEEKNIEKQDEKNIEKQDEMAQILSDEEKRQLTGNVMFGIIKRIVDVIFWLALAILALVWVVDFINVNNETDPKFCIKKTVHTYDDGEIVECTGAGYKVFKYNRISTGTGYEFGPFFIKMKDAN